MNSHTPTPRGQLHALSLIPASPSPPDKTTGGLAGQSLFSAAEFSESVRIVLTTARELGLDTPVFRSPPKLASVDRTIQRGGRSAVIAIRRDMRPPAAIQADIIEGVVVANYLDPESANEFRRISWSALAALGVGQPVVRTNTGTGSGRERRCHVDSDAALGSEGRRAA